MAFSKAKSRRGEARESRVRAAWRQFRQAGGATALALGAVLACGAILMDVWPIEPLPYRVGQYVSQDIHARADFSVPSRKKTDEEVAKLQSTTPVTFSLDANLLERLAGELRALPKRVESFTQPATLPENVQKPFALSTAEGLSAWRSYASPEGQAKLSAQVDRLRAQLAKSPLVRTKEKEEQAGKGKGKVRLGGEQIPWYELIGLDESARVEFEVRRTCQELDAPLRPAAEAFLVGTFTTRQQPIYVFNAAATAADIEEGTRAQLLNPLTDSYQAGDVLIRRLPKSVQRLSEEDVELLKKEHDQHQAAERKLHPVRFWLRIAGREIILLVMVALACAYVWRYRPEVVADAPHEACVTALLLLLLGSAKAMGQVYALNPFCAALPIVTGTLVLAIAYDQRFALAMGGILAALTAFILREDLLMLLVMTAGVTVSAGLMNEVRTRTKVILVSGVTGLAVMLGAWAAGAAQGAPWWPLAVADGAWGAGFALLAGFLVQGLLPGIERAFGAATSMTLLEWCDADKELLRRLRIEAPGTYSHSLQLGAICESAAEAIGARDLLARTGAYYHDVGKINKPEYFVENQQGQANRHARLSPAMSLLIITGHVRDGLELAREYGLPKILHEFIASHHGTTLTQYFFQAETDRRKAEDERPPEEVEFRYAGPRPRSKEAAILMLADACESSIRAMHEPTPGRIENQVHAIVTRRLMDGQLDDCELTFREVRRIEESFAQSLTAMYHTRVPYPTPPGEEPSAAEVQAAAKPATSEGEGAKQA